MADKESSLREQAHVEAKRASQEAKKQRAIARGFADLARALPRKTIPGVKLDYSFCSSLYNEYGREDWKPRVNFKLTGRDYREVQKALMRHFRIKTMTKGVWSSDNPEFYFEGLGEANGKEIRVRLMLGHVVPKGCVVQRGEPYRETITRYPSRRAYCGMRSTRASR
jgi:hypothetical protein